MKKAIFLLAALATLPTACASNSASTSMGERCEYGHTIFYAKMTHSGAEEKLCKVSDKEHYFYTKSTTDAKEVGVKTLSVKPKREDGTIGYTVGYDVDLSMGDKLELLALYKTEDNKKPIAGFLIFNEEVVELEASSIRHME